MKAFTDELLKICRFYGAYERAAVCCGNVSVPQCLALQELMAGPLPIGTVAHRMGASLSAMTRLVDGLEKAGWVKRRRADDDKRRVAVELTASGQRKATSLREQTDLIVAELFTRIPPTKRQQVLDSMRTVREAMDSLATALAG